MQDGIKKKSNDINFDISIFYLAINLLIDIFIITQKLNLLKKLFSILLFYLSNFKIERACGIPPASS